MKQYRLKSNKREVFLIPDHPLKESRKTLEGQTTVRVFRPFSEKEELLSRKRMKGEILYVNKANLEVTEANEPAQNLRECLEQDDSQKQAV